MKKCLIYGFLFLFITVPGFAFAADCTANMIDGRGFIIRHFISYDYDYNYACYRVDNQCRFELERFRRINPNRYARCVLNGPTPDPIPVNASCRADLLHRGYFLKSFQANASGFNYSEAKNRACEMAMNMCSREIMYDEYCRIF